MTMNHRIVAIHPATGEIEMAVYKEDWFGPGRDAIAFYNALNGPNYAANAIEWEFPPENENQP